MPDKTVIQVPLPDRILRSAGGILAGLVFLTVLPLCIPGLSFGAESKLIFYDITEHYRKTITASRGLIVILYYDSRSHSEDCDITVKEFLKVLGAPIKSRYRVDINKLIKKRKFTEIEQISRKEIGERRPGKISIPALVWYYNGMAVADFIGYEPKERLHIIRKKAQNFRKRFIEHGYIIK